MALDSIPFYKMSGCGNDFIVIDNRNGVVQAPDIQAFTSKICKRAMSAGADGLILLEEDTDFDFQWQFFNSDGSVAEMCGNGARCAARFAYLHGIAGREMTFKTLAGPIHAVVEEPGVRLKMTDPEELAAESALDVNGETIQTISINTGVPHVVITVDDIEAVDVLGLGRRIRYHKRYEPAGTNVNFISPEPENLLAIRTYERGVENETLACGTGAVAAAIVWESQNKVASPIRLKVRSGGVLTIHFNKQNNRYTDVYLEGDARIIYTGGLQEDAWVY